MCIEIKYKTGDKVHHLIGGALYEATIKYISRIENPGKSNQKVLYCISGGSQTYNKFEEDLYIL